MPPSTAEVNALMPGIKPIVPLMLRFHRPHITPATPAMRAPTMNVITIARFTSMPMRVATSLSSATARIDLPVRLRWMNVYKPSIIMMEPPTRNSWMYWISVTPILKAASVPFGKMLGYSRSRASVSHTTRYWRKMLTPMALIKGASRCARRSGR